MSSSTNRPATATTNSLGTLIVIRMRFSVTTRSHGSSIAVTAARDAHGDELRPGPQGDEAVFWLWKDWANVRVRNDGISVAASAVPGGAR